jgi:hypothetical protein
LALELFAPRKLLDGKPFSVMLDRIVTAEGNRYRLLMEFSRQKALANHCLGAA